jgi:hypothetical protein
MSQNLKYIEQLGRHQTLAKIKAILTDEENTKLDEILEYLYRNGIQEYVDGRLLPNSRHLRDQHNSSYGSLLKPSDILNEYVSSLSEMKDINKLKTRINASHATIRDKQNAPNLEREERKRKRGEMIADNTDANLLPPLGRKYLRAKRSFERASAKQRSASSSYNGGRKTRRQRRRHSKHK